MKVERKTSNTIWPCQNLFESLRPFLKKKKVKKKEILLEEGSFCKEIFFVEKGALRYFSTHEGKELIRNFFFEGNMACDFQSFLNQEKSKSSIVALEDSVVYTLSFEQLQNLQNSNDKFQELNTQIFTCLAKNNAKRVGLLLLRDSKERYLRLYREESKILLRVPQYMIASYLGMMPETLSRIRKVAYLKVA